MTTEEPADAGSTGGRTGPYPGETVRHGTGVNSTRAFPATDHPGHLDPFVLFEQFHIDPDQGFPTHPHRGFEIVSYMIEGGMEHEDSLGVTHTAEPGDAMRITTGSGIRHSEFPAGDAGCTGLQLWVNLPHDAKDVDADYADASADELPTETVHGATVTTVVGEGSPIDLHTPMEYRDVAVADEWSWSVPDGWSGFLYVVEGAGSVGGDPVAPGDAVTVADGGDLTLRGGGSDADAADELRAVVVSGRPHDEPIRQQGPFVL